MQVLVDTAVWVDHFRHGNDHLARLLQAGLVVCHVYVVIELACGTPPDRREILERLDDLPRTPLVTYEELLGFIQSGKVYGRGCGMVDIALLAATKMQPQTLLWTLDKRLDNLAQEHGCAYLLD
jgi:predicted nucleic acid-binding protein